MENREGYLEFITSESYKHQIDIWYRAYNISREKIELFYDFLKTLYETIDETYMGSEIMVLDVDIKNHFTWCWDKTIDSFNKERIYFKERGNHFEYFWNFFLEAYYYIHLNDDEVRINEYFYKLFDFKHKKSRSELDVLTELYKLFNQNLKK